MERGGKNLLALLDCVERSRLPVSLILVTVARTGVKGKYSAIWPTVLKFSSLNYPRNDCTGCSISGGPLLPRANQFVDLYSRGT